MVSWSFVVLSISLKYFHPATLLLISLLITLSVALPYMALPTKRPVSLVKELIPSSSVERRNSLLRTMHANVGFVLQCTIE